MASYLKNYNKNKNLERKLSTLVAGIVFAAPLVVSLMLYFHLPPVGVFISGVSLFVGAGLVQHYKNQATEKVQQSFLNLDIGYVLAKKPISKSGPSHFVISNKGFNHYYLKCLATGEQFLVSKSRVRDDFDIEN